MAIRSFQTKLLILLIAVLVLLQAGTLISVHLAGQRTLRHSIDQELVVGARVLDSILATRARQLQDSLRVLALDFAFREAIASADLPTITSVLSNHGSRHPPNPGRPVPAAAVVLMGLDGKVTADPVGSRLVGKPFPFGPLLQLALDRGE